MQGKSTESTKALSTLSQKSETVAENGDYNNNNNQGASWQVVGELNPC